ncbi:MAG: 4Fe-4S cluster-binding domain-containing protein [Chroococcidiopsidaceae cyanobacterium CP_BM_RX_35]|nr:4Fe-4S cluster-binding domain-containing protein [Chroococcidiopsidaceae cyanobacterium CP_BM_RX_35]
MSTDCELNVVHHCNLSCRACTHLSPTLEKYFVDADKIFNDFSTLAKYYYPKAVKILGGEPLLHPNLIQVIDAIRSSGITNRIHIVTNGHLLAKVSDLFWQKVDEVQVSVYPGKEISAEVLKTFQHKARSYNVAFQYLYFDKFRESYSEIGTSNDKLVRQIYSTCKMAHLWQCHTVDDGYFYKCPISPFIPKVVTNSVVKLYQNGIKIVDSPEFANDLLTYLESPEPLGACYHCLGSVGRLFPHEQKERKTWRIQQQPSTEELIDKEYLATLEDNPNAKDSCTRYRSRVKNLFVRAQRLQRNLAKQQ